LFVVSDNIREPHIQYTVPIGKEIYTKQDILPTTEGREQEEDPRIISIWLCVYNICWWKANEGRDLGGGNVTVMCESGAMPPLIGNTEKPFPAPFHDSLWSILLTDSL
jgi:hypothetical protein